MIQSALEALDGGVGTPANLADQVMAHLAARFEAVGIASAVPTLHRVLDPDGDNFADINDNCPNVNNPDQSLAPDGDSDGIACDLQSCSDGWKSGGETDVDCGGPCGATRAVGKMCMTGGDCLSHVCTGGVCIAGACNDGVENGDNGETDVDCGGMVCPACGYNQVCLINADCIGGSCVNHVLCRNVHGRSKGWWRNRCRLRRHVSTVRKWPLLPLERGLH